MNRTYRLRTSRVDDPPALAPFLVAMRWAYGPLAITATWAKVRAAWTLRVNNRIVAVRPDIRGINAWLRTNGDALRAGNFSHADAPDATITDISTGDPALDRLRLPRP